MKNLINNIFLVTLLFFIPLFAEGKSNEGKSFIQEIKEKITKEKEKVEKKVEKKEQEKVKVEVKEKEKNKDKPEHKDKNEVTKPAEKESRIKEVKDKIVKEQKKIEEKSVEKKKIKEKDKYNHDYVNDYNRKPYKKKYEYDYYPDIFWVYDDVYPDVTYYDYTYVDDSDLIYPSTTHEYIRPRKIIFLNSSVEAAYLGKDINDTYGVTAKVSANLYSFHFNCFYQNIFSSEESLTLYSINGGYSFTAQNVMLTPFIGAFYIEPLEKARFSYGANLQIFFPDKYNLDLYTLNSWYGSLNFNNFSASLNRVFYNRLNIGMGFNYNNYAGVSFSGPIVKLSLWL
jgi:hypothetical protein